MVFLDKLNEIKAWLMVDSAAAKRYYNVILTLLCHTKSLRKSDIKTYFKVKYNEDCDDAALDKVLSKFKGSTNDGTTWYSLTWQQYEKERITPFMKEEDIWAICFGEENEEIKSAFKHVLDVVRKDPSWDLLENGCTSISNKYRDGFGYETSPRQKFAHRVLGGEIAGHILRGSKTLKTIYVKEACRYLQRIEKNEKPREFIDCTYAVALRALNFEKALKNLDTYSPITQSSAKETVQKSSYYMGEIRNYLEQHPFDNSEDAFVNGDAERICRKKFYYGRYTMACDEWAQKDVRFDDAICYYLWQLIAEEQQKMDVADVEGIATSIYNYVIDRNENYID